MSEHVGAVEWAAKAHGIDAEVVEIRSDGLVPSRDVLLASGGESTIILRFLECGGITDEIRAHVEARKSILATCAGPIIASRDAKDDHVTTLDLLDMTVDRNAFGRQIDNFEAPLGVAGLGLPFLAMFIRTPFIDEIGEGIGVLTEWDGNPIAARDGPVVDMSFHPGLTPDSCLHDLAFFDELAVEVDI